MASVLLSPYGVGQQFFDDNGVPLAGGLIYTYQAGSSTPLVTYTDNGGTIANANPIVLDASGRTPQQIWLLTGYSYKFVLQNANAVLIQTLDNIYPILQNAPTSAPAIPSGGIIIWSGSTGSIPAGWYLCNGANGTPDLRDRFIVGAGNTYAVNATGGSADAIVVSHTHTAATTSLTGAITGVSFQFNQGGSVSGVFTKQTGFSTSGGPVDFISRDSGQATLDASHTHTINTAGVSGTNANLPPYYALAYIMKA
jgi:hypothetical protein